MYDLILSAGIVYDGLGNPGKRIDIAIKGERIVALGRFSQASAKNYISFKNLVIAPGFIDIHSHSDVYYLVHPQAECKIKQGVTTEVIGNCGTSAAPLYGDFKKHRSNQWQDFGLKVTWNSFQDYLQVLKNTPTGINIIPLVGHGNLRTTIKGFSKTSITKNELKNMSRLLDKIMSQGAWGMSTGLIYRPSMYADQNEIIALAKIVAKYKGIYTSHIRGEGDHVLDAVSEAINITKRSKVNLQISHLKVSGRKNWSKLDKVFTLIENGIKNGLNINCDRYPYLAGNTDLDVIVPDNALKMNKQHLIDHLNNNLEDNWSHEIVIGKVKTRKNYWMQGLSIATIATQQKKAPAAATIDLLFAEDFQVQAMFFGMSEKNLVRILKKPYSMIGSDSSLRTITGPLAFGHPHPRVFGTFPRVLEKYTGKGKIPLAQTIHKMTGMPAIKIGLHNRGVIAAGNYADITVFDPKAITDKATYTKPFQYAKGIKSVIVNGHIVFDGKQLTGKLPGKVLLKK